MIHRFTLVYFLLVLFSSVSWLACQPSNPRNRRTVATQDVLAQIGDQVITKKDLQAALMQMSPYVRAQYNSLARRKQLLLQLVEFEVLLQEAKKQNMQQTAEVQRLRKRVMVQTLVNRVVQKVRPIDISDTEIQNHWQKHRQQFPRTLLQEKESVRSALLQQKQTRLYRHFLADLRKRYPVIIHRNILQEVPFLPAKTSVRARPATVSPRVVASQPVRRGAAAFPGLVRSLAPAPRLSSTPMTTPSSLPHPPVIRNIPNTQPTSMPHPKP